MKILFLNTLNGLLTKPITDFIAAHKDTDIFCLQEAEAEMQTIADKLLPNYTKLYSEKYLADKEYFNQVIYVKNGIEIESSGVLLQGVQKQGLATYIKTTIHDQSWYICNVHGHPQPGDKLDTPDRIAQSQQIIDFFAALPGQKIIGGDFNLDPTTQSVKVFSQSGYKDLISDYGITSTRNEVSWVNYPDNKQYFADYVFVTPGVKVTSYEVPYNEVSDHLPQILVIDTN